MPPHTRSLLTFIPSPLSYHRLRSFPFMRSFSISSELTVQVFCIQLVDDVDSALTNTTTNTTTLRKFGLMLLFKNLLNKWRYSWLCGIVGSWYNSFFICRNGIQFMLFPFKIIVCAFLVIMTYFTFACTAEGVLNSFKIVYVCLKIIFSFCFNFNRINTREVWLKFHLHP